VSKQQQRERSESMVETLEPRRLLSAVLDLRLAGGGNSAVVSSVGQVINLDIIVTVNGTDANGANDGFQSGGGNLLSTNIDGGAALGTLKATTFAPFNATGSENGKQADLDSDGDIDVGTLDDTANPNDPFSARAGSSVTTGGTVSGNSQTFKIGTATFTVTKMLGGSQTNLVITPKQSFSAGLWIEDGAGKSRLNGGIITGGQGVTLTSLPSGTIAGRVFNDKNGNGIFDGDDVGLPRYRVWLDRNHDGLFDKHHEQYRYTSATGTYRLFNLVTSGYTIMTQAATGWRFSSANPAVAFAVNGTERRGPNFGETTNVLIKGVTWSDSNKDRLIQPIESRLFGWTVYDDVDHDGILDATEVSTTTDANGNYRFSNLAPGSHQIRVVIQSGFRHTTNDAQNVTLTSGQSVSNRNFGFKKLH
jgi:hypothetical protein